MDIPEDRTLSVSINYVGGLRTSDATVAETRPLCHCCSESCVARNIMEHKRTIELRGQIREVLLLKLQHFIC
jgi:hypothetical protein